MKVRRELNVENNLYFPIVELLELMPEFFPKFHFKIVEDDELPPDVHAYTDVQNNVICIKRSVYEGACNGNGRDRMTIAHEIGHYLLICVIGFKFQRNFSDSTIQKYQDPEWQAKCFAGELLIPAHLVQKMTPREIAVLCGVSLPAAETQWSKLRANKGRRYNVQNGFITP
ncbi:MAG: ImmA/IrrE family metallo-endopeptidase [Spirochaetota bacterium]|jgi:Zn-dependent peptidase ImmA (M78 family)|nr:ImmA/IrrE family metallo-endopeptidase [Spirochaetota bacterium]